MGLFGDLAVASGAPGALKHALNRSGWLDGEVLAAGQLRQGRAPSMTAMITGTALIDFARPRRSKALPRHFVLAVTADRVVAFKAVGGGDDAGPYVVRIRAGEQGSWPRGTITLTELSDGAGSKDATLQIAGGDSVPVTRPNLDGDPSTDELVALLAGLRAQPDARALAGDALQLAADAERGRPDFDLRAWADRRGLEYRGANAQAGHLSVTCPWSPDLLFNVVRGELPGGAHGVLCHEVRFYEDGLERYVHGGDVVGGRGASALEIAGDVVGVPILWGGRSGYRKVPYTRAGVRTPHLAKLTGLQVARKDERRPEDSGVAGLWRDRPLDDIGLPDWVARVRRHSSRAVVELLLRGPIRELLRDRPGLGFELRVEYGQAIAARQDFLRADEDLDALARSAVALGAAVQAACVPPRRGALAEAVAEPDWLASVRRLPREPHTLWPVGARLDRVVAVADERGLAVEDPRAFHAAHPGLNVPGEAFAVLRGRLPGTEVTGRLLCCAERRMDIPEDLRPLMTDPGGPVGCDVAVLEVDPATAPTAPEGELEGDLRVAVSDGVLTAWRVRPRWQVDGEALDRLARDAAAAAARRTPVRAAV